ncbi:uncharacterized protein LOC122220758 [Panthera leo]|uniref:uncharacterized protein LOC122220758 n=1 Tax=Panthera leo TaxID=9689 RepID=UPI001C69C99C|nr:uncharacterized protein LOC122220758 [Panthera leo]
MEGFKPKNPMSSDSDAGSASNTGRTRPDTTAKGREEKPGCHQRRRRGPRRKRLRSNGRCSASRTRTVTSSGPSPWAGAATAADYAAPVTVFLPVTAAKVGAAGKAELLHPAWVQRPAAALAQGRPPTYRPLTPPPPPLSGPERRADPDSVAAGGDAASLYAFPRVLKIERMQAHERVWRRGSKTHVGPAGGAFLKPRCEISRSGRAPSWIWGYRVFGKPQKLQLNYDNCIPGK